MTELEKLLSRLPSVEKAGQFLTYEGKAVSRDEGNLHLATTSGIIAIPLADIKEVNALPGQSSDIVSVSVTGTDGVKQIRHVSSIFRGGGGAREASGAAMMILQIPNRTPIRQRSPVAGPMPRTTRLG
jgi:hypothetical protein